MIQNNSITVPHTSDRPSSKNIWPLPEQYRALFLGLPAFVLLLIPLLAALASPGIARAAAPSGLHVVGNTLLDGSGARVLLHGVDRDGTEYACEQGWGFSDGPVDAASFLAIAAWHANAVRIPLNEHCWLGLPGITPAYGGANYQNFIATEVAAATAAGLVAILDLHASGPQSATGFVSGVNGQQPMADADYSPTFWAQVASAYKGNTSVIFDLFNEPFMGTSSPSASDWACWKNGCMATSTANTSYLTAGMAQLVSTVRTAGAPNVLLLGGLAWASNESQWAVYKPSDPLTNLAVSWHQYQFQGCLTSACWQADFNMVQASYPVISGEIGTTDCTTSFLTSVLTWMDGQNMSYLAWTWDTWPNCQALISSYSGTPTSPYGQAYQDHLAALPTASPTATPTSTIPATATPSPTPIPAITATPVPTITATPGPQPFSVLYQERDWWTTGYVVDMGIINKQSNDVKGWTIKWQFTHGETLRNSWNANCWMSGTTAICTNVSYNSTIPANGGSVGIGFVVDSPKGVTTAPTTYLINGVTAP